ncbi:MAG: hypothetical protein FJ290_12025 [Planctomycetes bacterium]|nr:hypothetical protein [Planctomycetota bacterium]
MQKFRVAWLLLSAVSPIFLADGCAVPTPIQAKVVVNLRDAAAWRGVRRVAVAGWIVAHSRDGAETQRAHLCYGRYVDYVTNFLESESALDVVPEGLCYRLMQENSPSPYGEVSYFTQLHSSEGLRQLQSIAKCDALILLRGGHGHAPADRLVYYPFVVTCMDMRKGSVIWTLTGPNLEPLPSPGDVIAINCSAIQGALRSLLRER